MVVDTGYFMSDERSSHGRLRPDVRVKDDWVLKAANEFPSDVVNLSSYDLRYFSTLLNKPEFAARSKSDPALGKLVSANIVSRSANIASPPPFVVRELPSRQPGSKPLRVAFIGLTEVKPAPPSGIKFSDPAEAAKLTVLKARKQADFVVVLAKVSAGEAKRIASAAPGIDVILAGNAQSLEDAFTLPIKAGDTLIAFTPFETRMLGELRVYRNAQGQFSTKQRFITLDELTIPEDPAAKQLVEGATKAESDARSTSAKTLEKWLVASSARTYRRAASGAPMAPVGLWYVTSGACSECHTAEYIKWNSGAHAHATDPLPPRAPEFEASCLDCHATGAKLGTAEEPVLEGMQGVGCEQCHGPGSAHVASPGRGYGRIPDKQSSCAVCHTSEASPGFDVQSAWEKIKH